MIMLEKHLIATCSPKATEENVVFWKDYRVTVLSDRLFRVERGTFTDEASQAVWFRDMPKNSFTVQRGEKTLVIATPAVALIVKEKWEDCRVVIDGKRKQLNNRGNLLGTFRTLDCCNGKTFVKQVYTPNEETHPVPLGIGVCSKSGVAVLDDSDTLLLKEDGELVSREEGAFDKYVFAFGKDYRGAVKALYFIGGNVPMIPRFALGNWWSRYHVYTDRSYLKLLNRFEERGVPLSVATIDMDWHYSDFVDEEKGITASGKNTPYYGGNNGWTGYSWNKKLVPDYQGFLQQIKQKDLKITLNLHPADGVRWWEDCYEAFALAMGKDPSTQEKIPFDIGNPEFVNNYFAILHKPYEKDGVDFWWIDWQQGTDSGKVGLDPLWALNHYHTLDNAKGHETPLILSRYCGAGAHRYPLGFTGDTYISWETLDYLPYFTATASNVGYTWWSHDIGGHMQGTRDEELYVRFLQFAVFNPINRLHSCNHVTITKEPWYYQNGCGEIAKKQLIFRHQLVPYLYSSAYRTHKDGLALVEPLYYEYPDQNEAYSFKNEYFFGSQLLVAPITKRGGKDGYASVDAWIPNGEWTDIFTGETYRGGGVKKLRRTLDSIPVLAKEGAVLPLASASEKNGCPLPQTLIVNVYRGTGAFTLYENEGEEQLFTHFENTGDEGKQTLSVTFEGNPDILKEGRTLKIVFANLPEGKISVSANGEEVCGKEPIVDLPTCIIENVDMKKTYQITLTYVPKDALTRWKEQARHVLNLTNGDVEQKHGCYKKMEACLTEAEFVAEVEQSGLPKIVIDKILETVR